MKKNVKYIILVTIFVAYNLYKLCMYLSISIIKNFLLLGSQVSIWSSMICFCYQLNYKK